MNLKSVETRIFPCQSKAAEQLNIYTSVKIFEAPQISQLFEVTRLCDQNLFGFEQKWDLLKKKQCSNLASWNPLIFCT